MSIEDLLFKWGVGMGQNQDLFADGKEQDLRKVELFALDSLD